MKLNSTPEERKQIRREQRAARQAEMQKGIVPGSATPLPISEVLNETTKSLKRKDTTPA